MARATIEEGEQIALFNWARSVPLSDLLGEEIAGECTKVLGHPPTLGDFMWHPPNGGRRTSREGARFKNLGVKPGVADIVVDLPLHGYFGARIELKPPPRFQSVVTPPQRKYLAVARILNYATAVCFGYEQAQEFLRAYLKGPEPTDNGAG